MRFTVLTPTGAALQEDADEVIAPLSDGWIGVLQGHTPFVSRLMRGHVVFRFGEHARIVATIGGLLRVDGASVTVLTGAAVPDTDLAALERDMEEQIARIESLEEEAEKHFDRVYRAMARTLNHGRDRL
jgi:F-type H+-transporting ATPase subunit epsilon